MEDSILYKELLSQIAEGNELAFRKLFDGYKNRVFGYVLAITHSHHAAEEITQELFIKLWTSRQLLVNVDSLDNYLFVMARHRTINYLQRELADERKRKELYEKITTTHSTIGERLIEAEYQHLLQDAVEHLSPQRKQVYELSRGHDLSLDEIAERLQLSRNTVKNHLVEALKQIREQLGKHGIGMLLLFIILSE